MKNKAVVLVGGSASVGSSLLCSILNSHSQIYCGKETNLFTNAGLILSNKKNNWSSLSQNMYSSTWHIHKGLQVPTKLLGSNSSTFISFIEQVSNYELSIDKKEIWVEKTPSNSVHFNLVKKKFPSFKLVLMIRNPLDAIASMINRGFRPLYATGLYLFNISMAMYQNAAVYVIKYEDILKSVNKEAGNLFRYLEVKNEVINLSDLDGNNHIESWNHHPGGMIPKRNSTFEMLDDKNKELVLSLCHQLKFITNYQYFGLCPYFLNIEEIATHFGYTLPKLINDRFNYLAFENTKEKLRRMVRNYPLNQNYPFEISSIKHI